MESDVRGFFPHFITVLVTTVCAESVTYGAGCPMGEAQKREREEGGVGRCGAAPIHSLRKEAGCSSLHGVYSETLDWTIQDSGVQSESLGLLSESIHFPQRRTAQVHTTRIPVCQCQTDGGGAAQEWHEVVNVIGAAGGRVQLVTLVGYGVHTRSSVGGFAGRNVIPDLPPGPVPRAVPQALRGLQCRDGACSVVKRVRQKGLRDSKRHI